MSAARKITTADGADNTIASVDVEGCGECACPTRGGDVDDGWRSHRRALLRSLVPSTSAVCMRPSSKAMCHQIQQPQQQQEQDLDSSCVVIIDERSERMVQCGMTGDSCPALYIMIQVRIDNLFNSV